MKDKVIFLGEEIKVFSCLSLFIPEAAENQFHKEWDESGSVYPARIVKAVAGCEDATDLFVPLSGIGR